MYDPKSTLIKISLSKNNIQSPKDLLSLASNINEEKIGQIYMQYENQLKKNKMSRAAKRHLRRKK